MARLEGKVALVAGAGGGIGGAGAAGSDPSGDSFGRGSVDVGGDD